MLNRKKINADFCVVGGGLSGMCAAIAAARKGLKVVLMHERPVLGGNASSEIRMWVCGAEGEKNRETGIFEEIALENYYRNSTKNYFIWDSILYDFVRREENLTLLLNCACMDAETENGDFGDGRSIKIKRVTGYQLTTQMFIDVYAKHYADCSGDSILAPLTGAEFMLGREGAEEFGENTSVKKHDDLTMGMSCLIQGRETDRPVKYTPPTYADDLINGKAPEIVPDMYSEVENFWYLELGGNRDTIHETEDIAKDLHSLAVGMWDYVKNSKKFDTDNWELDFLGFLPGKRESRRMTGEYIITQPDISGGKIFEDTVAYGGWPLDEHAPDGFEDGTKITQTRTPSPYCIPYRSLYSKNVTNLFFAGRNISATHLAMSSTRVMATCALMGQAVGTAAAIAVKNELAPNGVYKEKLSELQETLMRDDCFLPNFKRSVSGLCQITPIYGGNALKDGCDRPHRLYGSEKCGVTVKTGTALEYKFDKEQLIGSVHITFDSDLDRETLPGGHCERTHTMRCNTLLGSPQFYVPKTLCKKFKLEIITENGAETTMDENENLRRAYDVPINKNVLGIRLIPESTWGGGEDVNVFSFDF